jgi:predicted phosphodiesterase
MKNNIYVHFFLLAIFVLPVRLYALEIITGPCLQNPTETSITILWVTDSNCTSWVEYGTDKSLGQKAISSRFGLIDANQKIHRITITGLTAGTTWFYKVYSKEIVKFAPYEVMYGETKSSDIYNFRTCDREKNVVSFIVFNDIHGHKEALLQMLENAKKEPYDLVFLNGDIISHIDSREQIVQSIIQPCVQSFAKYIPLVYVRGNHETRGEFARQMPEYFIVSNSGYFGSFDDGPIHFVVMDSGEDKEDSHKEYNGLVDFENYLNQQQTWLEKEIQSNAFKKAPFRVVLLHMPIEAIPQIDYVPTTYCSKLRPLFEKAKIDLMICGHTHQPMIVLPKPGRSYPIIIGGGKLKTQSKNYTTIRVDGTNRKLKIAIVRCDGKVIDSYILTK